MLVKTSPPFPRVPCAEEPDFPRHAAPVPFSFGLLFCPFSPVLALFSHAEVRVRRLRIPTYMPPAGCETPVEFEKQSLDKFSPLSFFVPFHPVIIAVPRSTVLKAFLLCRSPSPFLPYERSALLFKSSPRWRPLAPRRMEGMSRRSFIVVGHVSSPFFSFLVLSPLTGTAQVCSAPPNGHVPSAAFRGRQRSCLTFFSPPRFFVLHPTFPDSFRFPDNDLPLSSSVGSSTPFSPVYFFF